MTDNIKVKRIKYIDYLRVVATIAVVLFHTSINNIYLESIVSFLLSFCVPVFLMITGALLLSKDKEVSLTYVFTKRILRTLGILLIWGFVYNFITHIFINRNISLNGAFQSVKMIFTADTRYCYQFWYLYMLVGLYLLIPLIKPWVEKNMQSDNPSKECYKVFGVLLGLSIVLPSILSLFDLSILAVWHGAFISFSGFAFYLLCGCWVHKWGLNKTLRLCLLCVVLIASVIAIILWVLGKIDVVTKISGYKSIVTWAISLLIFDLFRRLNYEKTGAVLDKIVSRIAADSLGIYIFHVLYLMLLKKGFEFLSWPTAPLWFSALQFIFAFLLSILTTEIVKRIPFIKRFV